LPTRRGAPTIAAHDLPPDRPGRDEPFADFVRRHYAGHLAQRRFCADPATFRAAVAGIGGGKTEVGSFDAIRHCIRFPGIKGLVVAPTYRMLMRSTRIVLKKVASWWGDALPVEEIKSEYKLVFPSLRSPEGEPSEIYFGHAQDPDSLRAIEVGFFWIDEAPLCKEDVFLICQGRIRQPGMPHRGWITGTPKGQNWVYRTFVKDADANGDPWPAERAQRYSFHTWKTHDNPLYLAEPDFLVALEESYGRGTDFYRQELEALFVALAGLVYKDFNAEKHVVAVDQVPRFVRVVAGIDWGVTSPGCILVAGIDGAGRVWFIDEVYERGKTISNDPGNDWLSIAQDLRTRHGINMFFADPEDANAILTFEKAGLPITRADNARIPGVREVQALIAGDRLRVVAGKCPNLEAEFGQYHWREDGDGKPIEDADPAKEFDHAMDPMRYIARGVVVPQQSRRVIRLVNRVTI